MIEAKVQRKSVRVEANETGIKHLVKLGLIEDGDVQAILKKYQDMNVEYITFNFTQTMQEEEVNNG